MDTSLVKKVLNFILPNLITLVICLILYYTVLNENPLGKTACLVITLLIIAGIFSYKSKGESMKYKIATFFIILFIVFMYTGLWLTVTRVFGFSMSNPLVIFIILVLFVFSSTIMTTRYINLNLIKALGLIIGLCFVCFTILIFILNKYLDIKDYSEIGIKDPWYVVAFVYLLYLLLTGATFYLEVYPLKLLKKMYKYSAIAILVCCTIFLLGVSFNKCSKTDGDKNKQPTWINTFSNIIHITAWFKLLLGHFEGSFLFAFISFFFIRTCKSSNIDIRFIPLSIIILIDLIVGIYKGINNFRKK